MRPIRLPLIFVISIAATVSLSAQVTPLIVGQPWDVGARAAGLGGGMTAVANDPSALHYNPAGLGLAKHSILTGTFSYLGRTNTTSFIGQETPLDASYTRFNEFGLCLPVPTSRGSLVFGVAYQRVRQYDDEMTAESPIDPALDPIRDLMWEKGRVEKGFLSRTSAGVSAEVAPGMFLGGALAIWGGDDDWTERFRESDPDNHFFYTDTTSTIHSATDYSGIQLNLGVLFKVGSLASLGLVLESPYTLKQTEHWDYRETFTWDSPDSFPNVYSGAGTDVYRIRMPMVLRGGMAVYGGPLTVSAECELVNYRDLEYTTWPVDLEPGRTQTNLDISNNFRNVLNMRFGGELCLPLAGARLRVGYARLPSHLQEPYSNEDRKVASCGAGFRLQDRLAIDFSVTRSKWTSSGYYFDYESSDLGWLKDTIGEKKEAMQFMVSFVYGL